MFHVQTEDSGRRRPKVVTLLYEGGVILTSRKTSYEDQLEADDLESVVRELMEDQHRGLVRALKDGELDDVVGIAEQTAPEFITTEASAPVLQRFGEGLISDRQLDEVILAHLGPS